VPQTTEHLQTRLTELEGVASDLNMARLRTIWIAPEVSNLVAQHSRTLEALALLSDWKLEAEGRLVGLTAFADEVSRYRDVPLTRNAYKPCR
jgi:hypothetical protein